MLICAFVFVGFGQLSDIVLPNLEVEWTFAPLRIGDTIVAVLLACHPDSILNFLQCEGFIAIQLAKPDQHAAGQRVDLTHFRHLFILFGQITLVDGQCVDPDVLRPSGVSGMEEEVEKILADINERAIERDLSRLRTISPSVAQRGKGAIICSVDKVDFLEGTDQRAIVVFCEIDVDDSDTAGSREWGVYAAHGVLVRS